LWAFLVMGGKKNSAKSQEVGRGGVIKFAENTIAQSNGNEKRRRRGRRMAHGITGGKCAKCAGLSGGIKGI